MALNVLWRAGLGDAKASDVLAGRSGQIVMAVGAKHEVVAIAAMQIFVRRNAAKGIVASGCDG
jgi:hypothetical protein